MSKKQTAVPLSDRLQKAVDEGNLEEVIALYESESKAYASMGLGMPEGYDLTMAMIRETVLNASRHNPRDIARQITRQVLSFQISLLVRAQLHFQHELGKYDAKYGNHLKLNSGLHPSLVDEHLPRIGKLQLEVRASLKALLAMEREDMRENGTEAA